MKTGKVSKAMSGNTFKDPPLAVRIAVKSLCILIAVFLIIILCSLGAAIYLNAPPDMDVSFSLTLDDAMDIDINGNLIMEIRSGESALSVGRRLENAGLIRSINFWYLLFRLDNEQVKTGTYSIALPASLMEIRSALISGEQLQVRVTIPEGFTLSQIARVLENEGICSTGDFLLAASSREILEYYSIPGPSMEGYLFPDTYLFPLSYPANLVIESMANNFFRRLGYIAPAAASLSPGELNDLVILASIVEREYRAPNEAALMAGVFNNRLRIGMALQSCATVVYVMTEILGLPHPERLLYRDLEHVSPFNTYIYPGLPPSPISAPGETALRGVFQPAEVNYFYFRLLDPASGRHYFSRTLDEHIQAGDLIVKGW